MIQERQVGHWPAAAVLVAAACLYLLIDGLFTASAHPLAWWGTLLAGGLVATARPALERFLRARFEDQQDPVRLEAFRKELARQPSARAVAETLLRHVVAHTGARAVCLYVEGEPFVAQPGGTDGPAEVSWPLGGHELPWGELRLHEPRIGRTHFLQRLVHYGELGLWNSLLAERTARVEFEVAQAQAQRDLQYRLNWTVSSRLCQVLDETQGRLLAVRAQLETAEPTELSAELAAVSERLAQLEGFVHANLKSVESSQAP